MTEGKFARELKATLEKTASALEKARAHIISREEDVAELRGLLGMLEGDDESALKGWWRGEGGSYGEMTWFLEDVAPDIMVTVLRGEFGDAFWWEWEVEYSPEDGVIPEGKDATIAKGKERFIGGAIKAAKERYARFLNKRE